jgi:hypothetical protein
MTDDTSLARLARQDQSLAGAHELAELLATYCTTLVDRGVPLPIVLILVRDYQQLIVRA